MEITAFASWVTMQALLMELKRKGILDLQDIRDVYQKAIDMCNSAIAGLSDDQAVLLRNKVVELLKSAQTES